MPISIPKRSKKLVLVLTTFTLVIEDSEKAILVNAKKLEQVMCIQYPIVFLDGITQDDSVLNPIFILFDSGNEINVIYLSFAEKLGFIMQTINVNIQKIDDTTFET